MKNQKLESIMDKLQIEHFGKIGIPNEILSDNGGQFMTNRWRDFAADMGFAIRKTSPYNPQSNPVERVMREIGRIIRVYSHENQTSWDKIIPRAEKTINSTEHQSTGFCPVDLHHLNAEEALQLDPRLNPLPDNPEDRPTPEEELQVKIQKATETLQKRASQRKIQTDKHGEADRYESGTQVWVKLHRRSDASRRLTRKIHLVYDGPFVIRHEVRRNAYVVEDHEGNDIGTYNSRQLKPHREAKMKPAEINMITTKQELKNITLEDIKKFYDNIQKKHLEENLKRKNVEENKMKKTGDILTVENDDEDQITKSPTLRKTPEVRDEANSPKKRIPRRRSAAISEKGMRHINRIVKLISGSSPLPSVTGLVENQMLRVLLDNRGEFNVISRAALDIIEERTGKLKRHTESKNIPAYLRQEKNVKFKAVSFNLSIAKRSTKIEAMILDGPEQRILLGRHACKAFGKNIRNSVTDPYELTRWSEHINKEWLRRTIQNINKSADEAEETIQQQSTTASTQRVSETPDENIESKLTERLEISSSSSEIIEATPEKIITHKRSYTSKEKKSPEMMLQFPVSKLQQSIETIRKSLDFNRDTSQSDILNSPEERKRSGSTSTEIEESDDEQEPKGNKLLNYLNLEKSTTQAAPETPNTEQNQNRRQTDILSRRGRKFVISPEHSSQQMTSKIIKDPTISDNGTKKPIKRQETTKNTLEHLKQKREEITTKFIKIGNCSPIKIKNTQETAPQGENKKLQFSSSDNSEKSPRDGNCHENQLQSMKSMEKEQKTKNEKVMEISLRMFLKVRTHRENQKILFKIVYMSIWTLQNQEISRLVQKIPQKRRIEHPRNIAQFGNTHRRFSNVKKRSRTQWNKIKDIAKNPMKGASQQIS